MIEFLTYIENSTDDYANEIQNELVKTIHNKVKHVKTDKSMEVGPPSFIEDKCFCN